MIDKLASVWSYTFELILMQAIMIYVLKMHVKQLMDQVDLKIS